MGAWKVLSDRGVATKVRIAGLDLIPEVVEKLKQGTFAVSAGGHWYEGALSVVQMYDFLHGIKPAQPVTLVTDIVVTKDNAAKFEEQFIKNPMEIDWKQRSRVYDRQKRPRDLWFSLIPEQTEGTTGDISRSAEDVAPSCWNCLPRERVGGQCASSVVGMPAENVR